MGASEWSRTTGMARERGEQTVRALGMQYLTKPGPLQAAMRRGSDPAV